MTDLAEMIQERPHLNDELERFRRLARFLEEVNGHARDLWRGVKELGDEQAEGPCVRFGRG
jgi:hypothetical protein